MKDLEYFSEIDKRIVDAGRPIKILSVLAWPKEVQQNFLSEWERTKDKVIPQMIYPPLPVKDSLKKLDRIIEEIKPSHPIENYLLETARSYHTACLMLQSLGTPDFTRYSIELYGQPKDLIAGSQLSNLEAAKYFIDAAMQFESDYNFDVEDYCISPHTVRKYLEKHIPEVITEDPIEVVIDDTLASKAAAGARQIRLRNDTCFTKYDFDQLLHHEVFTHSLTTLNGREQVCLKSMALGAPRTTATQEGLATFSEVITGSIDIARFKRIALRIVAIDMALNGADFFDVFKFFLNAGQNQLESYFSAMRIFRGGDPKGIFVFTKDTTYLHGLLSVHSFFRWAFRNKILDMGQFLFAGRMALGDVIALYPFVKDGLLSPPKYMPGWFEKFETLAARMVFSIFSSKIRLNNFKSSLG